MILSMKNKVQKKLSKEKFSFDQYWSIHYTECDEKNEEFDYKTIIKARSKDRAISILKKKVKEDDSNHKVKSLQAFMLRFNGSINNLKLNLKDWSHVKQASFPNIANHLFKFHQKRPDGYTNRFNSATGGTKGFKKGHKASVYIPPKEMKPYMLYEGKWKPWDKKKREGLKSKIKLALSLHNNSRVEAAEYLGISRKKLYLILTEKFVEVDWKKEYPPPPSLVYKTAESEERRIKNLRKTFKKKQQANINKLKPKVFHFSKKGLSRKKIAKKLGCAPATISKCFNE